METRAFLKLLEKSCERNGEQTILTLGHLKNLVALMSRLEDRREELDADEHRELVNQFGDPNF